MVSRWWMVCAVCSAPSLSTPAQSEPPPPSDSANQLPCDVCAHVRCRSSYWWCLIELLTAVFWVRQFNPSKPLQVGLPCLVCVAMRTRTKVNYVCPVHYVRRTLPTQYNRAELMDYQVAQIA